MIWNRQFLLNVLMLDSSEINILSQFAVHLNAGVKPHCLSFSGEVNRWCGTTYFWKAKRATRGRSGAGKSPFLILTRLILNGSSAEGTSDRTVNCLKRCVWLMFVSAACWGKTSASSAEWARKLKKKTKKKTETPKGKVKVEFLLMCDGLHVLGSNPQPSISAIRPDRQWLAGFVTPAAPVFGTMSPAEGPPEERGAFYVCYHIIFTTYVAFPTGGTKVSEVLTC